MAGLIGLNRSILRRILPTVNRRLVSTSKKNNETVAAEITNTDSANVEKNWISYGFNHKSKQEDRNATHSIFFTTVTLCITVVGFVLIYLPDFGLKDWAQREAFVQLKYREQNGLPLIDPNLIDPKKITLPSDEELRNTEIII